MELNFAKINKLVQGEYEDGPGQIWDGPGQI